jgi:hypothetical protein
LLDSRVESYAEDPRTLEQRVALGPQLAVLAHEHVEVMRRRRSLRPCQGRSDDSDCTHGHDPDSPQRSPQPGRTKNDVTEPPAPALPPQLHEDAPPSSDPGLRVGSRRLDCDHEIAP